MLTIVDYVVFCASATKCHTLFLSVFLSDFVRCHLRGIRRATTKQTAQLSTAQNIKTPETEEDSTQGNYNMQG